MPSSIARVHIARHASGWLTRCPACGWERIDMRRPAADRAAADHQTSHTKEART